MNLTPAALREIHSLQNQATQLLALPNLGRADCKRADLLIAKISAIRQAGFSGDEMRQQLANATAQAIGAAPVDFSRREERAHEEIFQNFLQGRSDPVESRSNVAFLAGKQTPIFTNGPAGGVLVPISFCKQVAEARALVDPLLDENVVTLVQEQNFTLRPLTIPGWDLSTVTAVKVAEAAQHNPDVIPAVNAEMLNRYTYRLTLAGSFEFLEDSAAYGSADAALARAIGIGFARGIGADLVTGDGSTGPQGVLTGAFDSGITTAVAGVLSLTDFTNIFFSLNKIYRDSPKCAWVMADATYKAVLNSKDSSNRPLFPLVNDELRILGKNVLVAPSMPSSAGSKGIVFGDLANYYVHSSSLFIQRRTQYPGLVEYGKTAWTALQMVDAIVDDPSDGANSGAYSPIKYATLHA